MDERPNLECGKTLGTIIDVKSKRFNPLSAPDHRPARLESARSILIFTIILRYRSVESDLRVSLVNNGLVGPYSATVLVTLPSASDYRPPRLESAR
ncbi:hypothetical protein TNCV_1213251 [Trichonephila clavipes]|nr:hypothetical protein TNCV_1213251 [Trichonephila clavipes]